MSVVLIVVVVIVLLVVGYLYYSSQSSQSSQSSSNNVTKKEPLQMPIENFNNMIPTEQVALENTTTQPYTTMPQQVVNASENIQFIEQPLNLNMSESNGSQLNQMPGECYPKDVLSSADLLPNNANTLWAQVNPSGQGSLSDQNFITAGYHVGVNTVGQTLRNGNRQLRSEPLNPQVKVSPWLQSTIEPDINRRSLEIN